MDDMIDTGNTLVLAAKSLQENGAKTIYALISHGMSLVCSCSHGADSQHAHRFAVRDRNEQN